eukprot:6213826-Pleurochrysis_carterae.AAC.3
MAIANTAALKALWSTYGFGFSADSCRLYIMSEYSSRASLACTFSGTQTNSQPATHADTDKAKPLKEPKILRTEQELRQRGGRRRDRERDLGADCLEQRSGNKQPGGERGDRKSRRAVAELK